MIGTVELKVRLEAKVTQADDKWIACCSPLDLYTQADSKDAALEALKEAVYGWFESCLERGVLEKALEEVGFRLVKPGDRVSAAASATEVSRLHSQAESFEIQVPAFIAAAVNSQEYATC